MQSVPKCFMYLNLLNQFVQHEIKINVFEKDKTSLKDLQVRNYHQTIQRSDSVMGRFLRRYLKIIWEFKNCPQVREDPTAEI